MGCAASYRGSTVLMEMPEQALLLAPEPGDQRFLINTLFLLLQTQTSVRCCCLARREETGLVREVLLPEAPIAGSSFGTAKLDNQGQREQQRRIRQVRVPNVTQDKRYLSVSQFKVLQTFKLSRLRSLILISNRNQRGKITVKQTNKQFSFVICKSRVTALLKSTLHWIFFTHLPCSQSSPYAMTWSGC